MYAYCIPIPCSGFYDISIIMVRAEAKFTVYSVFTLQMP